NRQNSKKKRKCFGGFEQESTAYSSAQCHSSEIHARFVFTNQTTRARRSFRERRRGEDEMNPVAEMKTNAAPESGSANGGKTQDTGSKTSTAATMGKRATLLFGATAGMPRRFKGNFDFQFVRTMGCTTYDGAEIGECYETASRIEDEKEDSYTEAWRVTAERVETIARKSLAGGHLVSAREAFLRASSYWREVGFYQCTTDPKCRAGWERQRDCFMQAGKLMDPPFEVVRIPY